MDMIPVGIRDVHLKEIRARDRAFIERDAVALQPAAEAREIITRDGEVLNLPGTGFGRPVDADQMNDR